MRSLELNLATRPFRNNTLVWAGYLLLLVAAGGFSWWNVSSYRHYDVELAALDQDQGNMEQERSDLRARHARIVRDVRGFDVRSIGRRTSKANEVIEWKAFSWTRLFNRLEEMLPHKVRMTSVRPVFRDRDRDQADTDGRHAISVTVEGLARDISAIHEIQTKLIDHDSFGWVKPRFAKRESSGEYSFGVDFLYYPGEASDEAPGGEAGEPAGEPQDASQAAVAEAANEPVADPQPSEVTDDWAERAAPRADDPAAKKAEPQPQRRSLPRVDPESPEPDAAGRPGERGGRR